MLQIHAKKNDGLKSCKFFRWFGFQYPESNPNGLCGFKIVQNLLAVVESVIWNFIAQCARNGTFCFVQNQRSNKHANANNARYAELKSKLQRRARKKFNQLEFYTIDTWHFPLTTRKKHRALRYHADRMRFDLKTFPTLFIYAHSTQYTLWLNFFFRRGGGEAKKTNMW